MRDTGNILPVVQANALLGLGLQHWLLLTTLSGEERHDLHPLQLIYVLREREGVSAPKPDVPLPVVTLCSAIIT